VENYRGDAHRDACLALLDRWKVRRDTQDPRESDASAVKRSKESAATALCLDTAEQLGLKGMVVYVNEGGGFSLRGFTFGEHLGTDQSSITIEKTDLAVKGLSQFIFSEFCRLHWSDRPFVNVGDDWGLPSLAWTKQSYRPARLLSKYTMGIVRPVVSGPTVFAPAPLFQAHPVTAHGRHRAPMIGKRPKSYKPPCPSLRSPRLSTS